MPEKTLSELQTDVAVLQEKLKQQELRFKQQEDANNKALELQADNYEKHLEALNHEAEQLKSMQSTYILKIVYERDNLEVQTKIDKLTKWQDVMSGRIIGFGLGWTVILILVQWYLNRK